MKILITGIAGFIGFHAAKYYAESGYHVIGIDNINDYYSTNLKFARLFELGIDERDIQHHFSAQSMKYSNLRFIKASLNDVEFIDKLFGKEHFDVVCHLAAQAGVRYSIENPHAYIDSNIVGFLNILEACRHHPVKHLVYASSSSVYGLNEKVPFSEIDQVDSPVSLYAASKKSNELMAYCYSKSYKIPTTGVRFFTVYGPWGRPDMAPYLFTNSIVNHVPIKVFNGGNLSRDFTYIDDAIQGLSAIVENIPTGEVPCKVFNLGTGAPVSLLDFIAIIEKVTNEKAIKQMVEMQKGDVYQTYADTSLLKSEIHFKPHFNIQEGIELFFKWYKGYVNNSNSQMEKNHYLNTELK